MRPHHILQFVCILLTLFIAVPAEDLFSIGGYLPDYRFYIDVNDTAAKLTDLIIFSLQPSQNGIDFPCCLGPHHFDAARKAASHKLSQHEGTLRLWVTIGGGGRSTEFLRAIESPSFIQSIVELTAVNSIDGIDLDCEHFTSQKDYEKYLAWLEHAIPELQQHGLRVSVAVHAGMLLPITIYEKVDRIHLMAYDMMYDRTSIASRLKDHYHADMFQTDKAVQKLVQSGCPRAKIILGIPAYARHYQNPGMVKTFAEIVDEATLEGIDQYAKLSEWNGHRGDSPESAARKVAYARRQKLGGVFVWELGQDKQADGNGEYLLEAITNAAVTTVKDTEEL